MQAAVAQQRAYQAQQQSQMDQQAVALQAGRVRGPVLGRSQLVAAAQQQRASQALGAEARALRFKEMLLDCGVNAFSRWVALGGGGGAGGAAVRGAAVPPVTLGRALAAP
jgi:hypothetical protein